MFRAAIVFTFIIPDSAACRRKISSLDAVAYINICKEINISKINKIVQSWKKKYKIAAFSVSRANMEVKFLPRTVQKGVYSMVLIFRRQFSLYYFSVLRMRRKVSSKQKNKLASSLCISSIYETTHLIYYNLSHSSGWNAEGTENISNSINV